jgi:hypothetical protein
MITLKSSHQFPDHSGGLFVLYSLTTLFALASPPTRDKSQHNPKLTVFISLINFYALNPQKGRGGVIRVVHRIRVIQTAELWFDPQQA